ncbi:DNA polymerase III subunit alpha [Sporosarcina sp. G11-34]|uniref:DNA polymerase III subunit alpha n=1 Tax=Sporosarcina sp. G11-34 TaxID=2849605 RepID=UPI0022A8FCCD|nr:DNA polymerase III subunit alpha [Sporosarcina sp. G11-34]MCZ2257985.1 DNA polymerase III subunit alpha [Sporosarcina sp. G11-34]
MTLVYPQIITGADLLRGIIKLNYLAPLLKSRGASAAAIVNSKLYGVRSFCKTMKKYDIHPVIGLSVKIDIGENRTVLSYVYAKNDEGYKNLLKMSSAVSVSESENLPLHWLAAYSTGCILTFPMTDPSWEGLRDEETIELLVKSCGGAEIVLGVARVSGVKHSDEEVIETLAIATNLQIAAVYESRFIHPEDSFSYEVAEAIRLGHKLNDVGRLSNLHENAYVPEEVELTTWFTDKKEWLDNMSTLLLSCSAEIPPSESLMPVFPVPAGENSASLLKKHCLEGLVRRLDKPGDAYEERLHYELAVIEEMGYSDYFLIVEDFMHYAAEQNILTGPGRGSSAGSLVAFTLGITDVDPLRYGLVFERFLNPSRVTMPDIDIDFADNRREEVIEYVVKKYGKSHVAQIITFGTLSARAVARNVARVFGFSNEEMGFITHEIPNRLGITLGEAFKESKGLRDWVAMDPLRSKWFESALALEGLPRNASTHAAGVILSPKPLVNTVPLQTGGDGIYLTQWPMGDVEEQGLLKMDFLGLRNLTLLDRIRSMISFDKGVRIDFEKIPLDDELTYELFKSGDTSGVFQFESAGMRNALRLIQPSRFQDIYAINALYRPGPMDNIPLYSRRKHGQEQITYIHPSLESVLAETYGVIVYQEQIMKIAVEIAGFSMGEADLLRRAISKKDRSILNEERIHFTESAVSKGFPESAAIEVYDLIVKFAEYGFPKSHAVAYSLISYRLAYLKANEPAYFYAALLSTTTGNNDKTVELIREAETRGIQILAPSVSQSKYMYTVQKNAIRIGLSSIKGVTPGFYNALKEVRKEGGVWETMFDLAAGLGGDVFTNKIITQLIKAGALDEFNETRSVLLASIEAAISHALFLQPSDGEDFLTTAMHSVARPKYSPGELMPRMVMLDYEREVLGFYLSEHPAAEIKKTSSETFHDVLSLNGIRDRQVVKITGLITEIKRIRTKKGESMAFVSVQDETGTVSCTLFPKQYAVSDSLLDEMKLVIVQGTIERRKGQLQILVQKIEKA